MLFKSILVVIIAIVILPFLKQFVLYRVVRHNLHKHHPGKCRQISRPGTGSEDIHITSSGLAFITSGLAFNSMSEKFEAFIKSKSLGHIELYDMNSPFSSSATAIELKINHDQRFNPLKFRPHGLSVLEDKVKGEHLIYVINHVENEEDRVEKFRYLPRTKVLQHITSIYSDLFRFTNDLTLVTEDTFYISNYLYSKNKQLGAIEKMYDIPLGNVVFYNGSGAFPVLNYLQNPNGIVVSKDRRFIYLNALETQSVKVYERHSDLDLRLVQEVPVYTGPDNFYLGENGDSLWVGCHPYIDLAYIHLDNPEVRAPSQVLRLPLKDGLIVEKELTEEFYDHGDLISGSTVAGVYNKKMIVGSIMDSLVICEMCTQ